MTTIDNFSAITMEPKQFINLHLNFHSEMILQEDVINFGWQTFCEKGEFSWTKLVNSREHFW